MKFDKSLIAIALLTVVVLFQGLYIHGQGIVLASTENTVDTLTTESSEHKKLKDHLILKYDLYSSKADRIATWAIKYGNQQVVDPYLIVSLIKKESYFKYNALSHKGAVNLMQVMPFWAKEFGIEVSDLYNPEVNMAAGARIIRGYMDQCGGLEKGLRCYHGGPNTLKYVIMDSIWYARSVIRVYNKT